MSFIYWSKVAMLALLPAAAIAQQLQQPNPTDANAAVREVDYVSAFANYPIPADDQETPDRIWRAANDEVGRSDPHAGHAAMPDMKAQPDTQHPSLTQSRPHAGHSAHMATPGANTDAAVPKVPPAQPDPHAGHANHIIMQGKQ